MLDTDETTVRAKKDPQAAADSMGAPTDSETLGTATDVVIDMVTIRQQQALESAENAGAALVAALAEAQHELADFVAERIRQDIDTQRDMIRCSSFAELQKLQARFLKTAVDQYAAEANRLVRLGSDTMAKSLRR